MKDLKCFSLMLIAVLFAMGCSGTYGNYINQSESETKVTKRELIENWSDYDIWLCYHTAYEPDRLIVIIFDPKNDDKEILVESSYIKVRSQSMWREKVNANMASDGEFTLFWDTYGRGYTTGVQEILGLDNQFYGYVIHQQYAVSLQRVDLVDENTVSLFWRVPGTRERY